MKVDKSTDRQLRLLYVSAEIGPYAITGGLGDVSEALPGEISRLGVEVIRIMPKYRGIEERFPLEQVIQYMIEVDDRIESVELYRLVDGVVPTYYIGSQAYFEREDMYGYEDDGIRFGFFSKAVLQALPLIHYRPHVLHVNDWHGGLIPFLLKTAYNQHPFYKEMKAFYTIHNLQYQGIFQMDLLERLHIPRHYFHNEALEFYGNISYMKAGIIFSDTISTVSHTYAKEIQTSTYGYGLDGILRRHKLKLIGIINGVHYDLWNPSTDSHIYHPYDVTDAVTKKAENKKKLQKEVGLPLKQVPLVSMVSRLTDQKGIDLAIGAIKNLGREDVQFLILGTGEEKYQDALRALEKTYPDKVRVLITFNLQLARKIYGASDFFMMPSLFEPCGLSQLYSMRYGTVPIVRKTGGLVDTVEPYNQDSLTGCGYVFEDQSEEQLTEAIRKALHIYKNEDKQYQLIKNCMEKRFSWEGSAKTYVDNYKKLVENI